MYKESSQLRGPRLFFAPLARDDARRHRCPSTFLEVRKVAELFTALAVLFGEGSIDVIKVAFPYTCIPAVQHPSCVEFEYLVVDED